MQNRPDTFEVLQHQPSDRSVHMSVTFSVLLLTFVLIELLLAVRRPHTFSLNSLRAKRALVSHRCSGRCVHNSIDSGTSQTVRTLGSGFSRDCHINKRHGHDGVLFIDGNNDADERTRCS